MCAEVDGESGGFNEVKCIGTEGRDLDCFGVCLPFRKLRQACVVDGFERVHIFENTS
ncbi:hypothetical protein D3C87_1289290 [compost metagenome]